MNSESIRGSLQGEQPADATADEVPLGWAPGLLEEMMELGEAPMTVGSEADKAAEEMLGRVDEEERNLQQLEARYQGNETTRAGIKAFEYLVRPLTKVAARQILAFNPQRPQNFYDLDPEGASELNAALDQSAQWVEADNPSLAACLRLAKVLLKTPDGNLEQLKELARQFEGLAWECYTAGKPTILFLRYDEDIRDIYKKEGQDKDAWQLRATLFLPDKAEVAWSRHLIHAIDEKYIEKGWLKPETEPMMMMGKVAGKAGTELKNELGTRGESFDSNGCMIDLQGEETLIDDVRQAGIPESRVSDAEIHDIYVVTMAAHERAHRAEQQLAGQGKIEEASRMELQEWRCEVLSWWYMAQYFEAQGVPVDQLWRYMKVLTIQAEKELSNNPSHFRGNPATRGYRASELYLLEAMSALDLEGMMNRFERSDNPEQNPLYDTTEMTQVWRGWKEKLREATEAIERSDNPQALWAWNLEQDSAAAEQRPEWMVKGKLHWGLYFEAFRRMRAQKIPVEAASNGD